MADYSKQILSVYGTLLKKGQSVTITRKTAGDYDASTGSVTITESTETGMGLPLNYSDREIDGVTVQQTDTKLILSAHGISKPQINDNAEINGRSFTIKNVKELWPGGDAIMYTCQLRA